MPEGTLSLANITDIVTTVAAGAGLWFGVAGYRRSVRTDHELRHYPYFKRVWPKIRRELVCTIRSFDWTLNAYEGLEYRISQLASDEHLTVEELRFSEPPETSWMERFEWTYDGELRGLIVECAKTHKDLLSTMSAFGKLALPSQDNELSTYANYNALLQKYRIDPAAMLPSRLRLDPRYRKDVKNCSREILSLGAGLKIAVERIRRKVEYYDILLEVDP